MKLEDLSLRQVAVAVPILGLLNWAFLQFVALPNMTEDQRNHLYSGGTFAPYLFALGLAFVCFAIWFVFIYRGALMTQGRKIAVFGMALGSVCGMLMILVIRFTWHI
jgi:Sec-independent protein secretion pathway component TatC